MVTMQPPICDFNWKPPEFSLPGIDGKKYSLADVREPKGALVMFICNHCPYVKAVAPRLVDDVRALSEAGIGTIAIMSNDTEKVPEDSFENMKVFAQTHGFTFPYVIDETQNVAAAYGAICTPDFFGFNSDLELQYRGRLDQSGQDPAPPGTRRELLEAMARIAETGRGPTQQIASVGCSIKWR